MSPPQASPSQDYLQQVTAVAGYWASYMKFPVLASSGLAAIVSTLLYFKQKALIYPSHLPASARSEVPRPSHFGITNFDELLIPTPDGESLSAFYIRPSNSSQRAKTTILMFHGNAGNIGHRIPIARMLIETLNCSVLMLEYRGYGMSTGSPDEEGLCIDAQTGLDWLKGREETKGNRIVIYGQSLGGAVAINVVGKNQDAGVISGLILENTFLSMRKLIPSIVPPARYITLLCHQLWNSELLIPKITEVPVLFLSGFRDEIVPPAHMRKLYEICQSPTKIWKGFPEGDHNSSVLEAGYFEAIEEFVTSLPDRKATSKSTGNFKGTGNRLGELEKEKIITGDVETEIKSRRGYGQKDSSWYVDPDDGLVGKRTENDTRKRAERVASSSS